LAIPAALLIILFAALVNGCAAAGQPDAQASPSAGISIVPTEPVWTFPLSKDIMADAESFLTLANADNRLSDKDKPDDLVNITVRKSKDSAIQLRRPVSAALKEMFAAADADGVKLYAHSGYRSYHTQDVMHYNRVKDIGYDDKVVQQAGASDHQTGMGIDIISASWIGSRLTARFAETKEGQWIAAHCAEYGFIIRYPEGKEDITKIIFEPWHLRYVGVEAARYITDNALTLEEFWDQWNGYQDGSWAPDGERDTQSVDAVSGTPTVIVEDVLEIVDIF
jgi:D-alanyl-D-alanine carboxypeptidase